MIIRYSNLLQLHFLFFLLSIQASAGTSGFELIEFQPGIYVHQGVHVEFDKDGHDDIANIGFIEGKSCLAIIDTGGSVTIANQFKNSIRTITDKPICYVINTHVHFDHVLGNHAFADADTCFVGHQGLKDELINSTGFFIKEYTKELGITDNGTDNTQLIILPDIQVEDKLELDLGNRMITITAYAPAHSHTDISIYDHNTDTLWLSDLLFVDRIPAVEGKLRSWVSLMQTIAAGNPGQVIPGHGRLDIAADEALATQQAYLETLVDETRQMISKGAFIEEAIKRVGSKQKANWLLHEQHHKRNVSNAFVELEWE